MKNMAVTNTNEKCGIHLRQPTIIALMWLCWWTEKKEKMKKRKKNKSNPAGFVFIASLRALNFRHKNFFCSRSDVNVPVICNLLIDKWAYCNTHSILSTGQIVYSYSTHIQGYKPFFSVSNIHSRRYHYKLKQFSIHYYLCST